MMSPRALTICFLSFFCIGQISGQLGERYTEAEIQFQYDFLTAKSLDINSKPDKAIESLKALYDQDRTKASVAFELSKAYLKKENLENALNYSKIAVTKDDSNQYYQQYLADLYEKNYEFGDAASVYQGLPRAS